LKVIRDGRLALCERMSLEGLSEPGSRGLLESPLGLMGRPVSSYFLALGPEAGEGGAGARLSGAAGRLAAMEGESRSRGLPEFWGVTVRDGILIARSLGVSVAAAERFNRLAWSLARPALLGREALNPRVWRT
jgi:urease accessory protein